MRIDQRMLQMTLSRKGNKQALSMVEHTRVFRTVVQADLFNTLLCSGLSVVTRARVVAARKLGGHPDERERNNLSRTK
jgi:hypothetical protein